MGQSVDHIQFSAEHIKSFENKIRDQLLQLKQIMRQPNFASQPLKMGAELECYLVDDHGHVKNCNQVLLEALKDPEFQHEINQYNLELNFLPVLLADQPFSQTYEYLLGKFNRLNQVAKQVKAQAVPIGILPTLRRQDLLRQNMTPTSRYQYLVDQLKQAHDGPFEIKIDGQDGIRMQVEDVTAEGANTSLQVHMMIPAGQFADVYNAAILTQPLVTALAANSPLFLGRLMWEETRIPLLSQILDCRAQKMLGHTMPARVTLGAGWLKQSAWELYAQAVALHPVLLPYIEPDKQIHDSADSAGLAELNLHMGTIWHWHRPVYCAKNGGHIRLEFRALPAGPSVADMIANIAFSIGLAYGYSQKMHEITAYMPFDIIQRNFTQAARYALSADLCWPQVSEFRIKPTPLVEILAASLQIAREGLTLLHIQQSEIDHWLGLVETRIRSGSNGASWQRKALYYYEQKSNRHQACIDMLHRYIQEFNSTAPVANWRLPC